MKTKHVAQLVMVLMIVGSLNSAARSFGQSAKRDDSLKPFTTCELDNGLRIVQVDRLPKICGMTAVERVNREPQRIAKIRRGKFDMRTVYRNIATMTKDF